MSDQELLGQYIIKQVIVELRHMPNLLHQQKTPVVLNNYVDDFEKLEMDNNGKIFQLINNKKYTRLTIDWQKIGMQVENISDFEGAIKLFKKYLGPISSELEVKKLTRFGARTIVLFPFKGTFEELVTFYCDKFYKDMTLFEAFGKVNDVGIIVLTILDSNYNIYLSLGPFSKKEIKEKISSFKEFDDKIDCSLMLDIDLSQDTKKDYIISSQIENALEAARIKIIKFRELILNK
jgi:hypothetical protein